MIPIDEVRCRLREYIRSELLIQPECPFTNDEALIAGGLIDSFSIAHLGVFIESNFGVCIADVDLADESLDSVSRLAERIVAMRQR